MSVAMKFTQPSGGVSLASVGAACAAVLLGGALCLGCGASGGSAFGMTYPHNDADALAGVAARIAAQAPASETAVAVGLGGGQLYAWDLASGRQMWSEAVTEPQTAPHIAGDLVVLHEGSTVVARSLASGQVRLRLPDERLSLVGAAGEGNLAAIVLSTTGGGVGSESRLVVVRGGGVAFSMPVEQGVGEPTVRAGLVFVPWGSQNVSVIDGSSGAEIARVVSHDGVIGHARASADGVFFGQAGVGRIGADAGSTWSAPATLELPGAPPLWRNAYDPPAGPASATHRVRIAWAPRGTSGRVTFAGDAIYAVFYRFVFALSPEDLSVRWVHRHSSDIVGATVSDAGLLLADAGGALSWLSSDGSSTAAGEMGGEPTVVALRAGSARPSGSAEPNAGTLAEQLLSAAQDTDTRLVPARELAVRALAAIADDSVTTQLITLCEDTSLPATLRTASCGALASRSSGAAAVLAALGRHANHLEQTGAPPVGALAQVAARLEERRAVPLLLAQLEDPATPSSAIVAVARALAALGDASARERLLAFLWLYHAEPPEPALAAGLAAVAAALHTLAPDEGREALQAVVNAPFSDPTVAGLINERLAAIDEAERQAAEAAAAEAAAAEAAANEAAASEDGEVGDANDDANDDESGDGEDAGE